MSAIEILNDLASRWIDLVWAVIWQAIVLGAVVALIAWTLRRSPPNVRYWLWQILAIKLLLMPFWTISISLPEWTSTPTSQRDSSAVSQAEDSHPTLPWPDRVSRADATIGTGNDRSPDSVFTSMQEISLLAWLMLSWAGVVVWRIARIVRQRVQLASVLRQSHSPDPALVELVAEAAAAVGLPQAPRTLEVAGDTSPFVCGLLRPTLVLPGELADSLDPARLRHVLLHELAHLRRRDLLLGWIPEIARTLYFFHPIAHWAAQRIRLESELACDHTAMALSGAMPADYAETLIQVVSRPTHPLEGGRGLATTLSLSLKD